MREVKFRIPHYYFNNNFVKFTYWGRIEKDTFSSPSTVNLALNKKPDEQDLNRKDKNGKEIYEKDMVKKPNGSIREVGFNQTRCQFGLYSRSFEAWITNELISSECEIIGNIHESEKIG